MLDYSLQSQFGLFQRIADGLRGHGGDPSEGPRGTGPRHGWILLALAGALALLVVAAALLRRGRERTRETRLYLALVNACRKAGVVNGGPVTPLALVEALERSPGPAARSAAPAAARLVDLYLQARFGGRELLPEERERMAAALEGARGALRRRGGYLPAGPASHPGTLSPTA